MLALTKNQKWWVIISLGLMMVMINIDLTIVNLAVPTIAFNLQSHLSEMQWVINAYSIMSAIFMVIGGRMGDIYGKYKTFLAGLIIFTSASFLGGLSTTPAELILSRALQGVGYGITLPVLMVIAFSVFKETERAFAVGIFASIAGVTQAIGPSIGGVILNFMNWHWIFLFNVPVGIIAFFMMIYIKRKFIIDVTKQEKMNGLSAILLALGLVGIILAIIEIDHWSEQPQNLWLSFLLGVGFLFLFYLSEKKSRQPLMDFNLFKIKPYLMVTLIRAFCAYCFFSTLFLMPIYLQSTLGYNPLEAGLLLLSMTIFFGGFSPIAGKLFPLIGSKYSLMITTGLYVLGFFVLYLAIDSAYLSLLISAFILLGIATGFMVTSTTTSALSFVPIEKSGAASGIYYTISMLGSALGVAVSGSLLSLISTDYLNHYLFAEHHFTEAQTHLIRFIAHGLDEPTTLKNYFSPKTAAVLVRVTNQAFIQGLLKTIIVNMGVAILALGLVFKLTPGARHFRR